MEANLEIKVRIVAGDFIPGAEANLAIARLLGHDPEQVVVPDYCGIAKLTAEHMQFQGRVPYVKPIRGRRGFVCIFDHAGEVCVTKDFAKASYALAAALFFTLQSREKVSQV